MKIVKLPQGFPLCINNECKMAASCTRNVVYQNLSEDIDTITILNPRSELMTSEECPKYHEFRLVRNAYGFKALYKTIPVGKAEFFWTKIKGIGSESTYYRMKRGQIAISPELQEQILALAKECGAPDGVEFDEYRDEFCFG